MESPQEVGKVSVGITFQRDLDAASNDEQDEWCDWETEIEPCKDGPPDETGNEDGKKKDHNSLSISN